MRPLQGPGRQAAIHMNPLDNSPPSLDQVSNQSAEPTNNEDDVPAEESQAIGQPQAPQELPEAKPKKKVVLVLRTSRKHTSSHSSRESIE